MLVADGYSSGMDVPEVSLASPAGLAQLQSTLHAAFGHLGSGPPTIGMDSNASEYFPVGTRLFLVGLKARPELNNKAVTVAPAPNDIPKDRIAVILDDTAESLRVK
eukprot:1371888-Karenia_brevis.AAC.1